MPGTMLEARNTKVRHFTSQEEGQWAHPLCYPVPMAAYRGNRAFAEAEVVRWLGTGEGDIPGRDNSVGRG